jgi:hypothetical protein
MARLAWLALEVSKRPGRWQLITIWSEIGPEAAQAVHQPSAIAGLEREQGDWRRFVTARASRLVSLASALVRAAVGPAPTRLAVLDIKGAEPQPGRPRSSVAIGRGPDAWL